MKFQICVPYLPLETCYHCVQVSPEVDEGCLGPVDYTVRRLAEKFSVVNMKSASMAAENVFVENEIFSEMTDSNSVHSL